MLRTSEDNLRALVREGRLRAVRVRPRGRLLFDPADVRSALHPVGVGVDEDTTP